MEIKEFRSRGSNDKRKKQIILVKNDPSKKKNSENFSQKFRDFLENRAVICLCGFCLLAVLTMILGITVFHIPVLTVVLVLLIEAGMAACLHNLPVWLHVVVLVAQLLLGGLVSQVVFMILAVLCYGLGIFTLKFEAEKNK
ncbi:MAG: hypothetical protein MR355_06485 [Lachnospiraceae bacterium]|nr:hypothetical protein [Lachnospiraceae bacterium]